MKFFIKLLASVKRQLYCNYKLYVYLKEDKNVPVCQPRIEVDSEIILTIRDLRKYYGIDNIKNNSVKYEYFLKNGCKIYFFLCSNEVAGHVILANLGKFRPYPYHEHPVFEESDNSFYLFFGHVFPKFRGNGLHPYMNTFALRDTIRKNGKVYATADIVNIAAQKGIKRANWPRIELL